MSAISKRVIFILLFLSNCRYNEIKSTEYFCQKYYQYLALSINDEKQSKYK